MRGSASSMTVIQAKTAAQAIQAYALAPDALPLAGGTDLMVAWNLGELNDRTVLDLSPLAKEWGRIDVERGRVRIGALATHTALQRHAAVRRHFPLLVSACATVGGVQIQNRGTIGGNIANASPAGDTFPPLAVYDALVHVVSSQGGRSIPFLDAFAGPKKTTLAPGELIEAVELPLPVRAPDRQMFRKVGTRAAQAISKCVAAGLLWVQPDGIVEQARLAAGSVAPTVRRLRATEAFLKGKRLTPGVVDKAAQLAAADISPIDDIRSTSRYRLAVCQRLVQQFLGY